MPKKKIAIFADQNNFSFMTNIINHSKSKHEVKLLDAFKKEDIELAINWADSIWIDWAENLVNLISSVNSKPRVVCRLHSYEAYLSYIEKINWQNLSSVIFISQQIRDYVEKKAPILKNMTNVYTLSEGVDLEKFKFKNRTHGNNIAFVAHLIQTKNISLLLQAFKFLKNTNPDFKLHIFGKYTNDSGVSPEIPKRYFENQITRMNLVNEVHFYNEVSQEKLVKKMEPMNYLISTSYREGLPFNILEGMAMGIMPLIHAWPGAEQLFPEEFIFDFIGELPEKLKMKYDSNKYRKFVEDNHNLNISLPKMEKILIGEDNQSLNYHEENITVQSNDELNKESLKKHNRDIHVLYLAIASPSYPQILDKINQQLKIFKQYSKKAEGFVVGYGELDETIYNFKYINVHSFKYVDIFAKQFSLIDDYVEYSKPDIIYFRYPGASKYLAKFVEKFPNVIFEHQTQELNEYATLKDKIYLENEIEYGEKVLSKAAGITTITHEVAQYEQNRANKKIAYHVFGNGTWEEAAPIVKNNYPLDKINILFVGHFSGWHGFDRIINGMVNYKDGTEVHIHVVGEGEKKGEYLQIINKFNLADKFTFHGFLTRKEISKTADVCHIAVGSLGLHRIGFNEVAPLKHREYCLRGIPFVISGSDVDFPNELPFVKTIVASEEPVNISELINFAEARKHHKEIIVEARKYAIENLTWEIKISRIIDFLVKRRDEIQQGSRLDNNNKGEIYSDSLVSIVIPCFNQANFLVETVESVIAQTYENWECIIVNDGSTDNTSEIAANLLRKYKEKKIYLLETKNSGLSSARNNGIRKSKGKFFIPLDADDKLEKTFVEKTLAVIKTNPRIGFVYSNIQHFGERNDLFKLPQFNAAKLLGVDNIASVCSLVKKEVWEAIGGYNELMKEGYEDWDFWISAVKFGWIGYRIDEGLFYYRKRKESMLNSSNKKREKLIATIIKNHSEVYSPESKKWANDILNKFSSQSQLIDNKKLKITFLINSIQGVTGGNQTLLKMANELLERGYKVTIVTHSEKPGWFELKTDCMQVPENKRLSSYVPESDVVVSTYFMNTQELNHINAPLKIYYAQGDQYVFQNKIDVREDLIDIVSRLRKLSELSYQYQGIKLVVNSNNLGNAIELKFGRKADALLPVGIDENIFKPVDQNLNNEKLTLLNYRSRC